MRAAVERDPRFGTDIYADVTADFGDFIMDFYGSTQMALRQEMLFHGEKGAIEVTAPFNAGDYGHAVVTLHNQDRSEAQVFRFQGVRQYRNMLETFADVAQGNGGELFSLENSKANQKLIDAVYRAGESDGWETV